MATIPHTKPASAADATRLEDSESVGRLLRRRIEARTPTSVIRLGDGEGVVLGQPDLGHRFAGPYLVSHFGKQITQAMVEDLSVRLKRARDRAWSLGVRPDVLAMSLPGDALERPDEQLRDLVRDQPSLRPIERAHMPAESAYRLALLHETMHRRPPDQALLTTAWCHFDWLESGLLRDLVAAEHRIGLVSGRPELVERLRATGTEVDYWPVPLRYSRRERDWTPHLPDRFSVLVDTLAPSFTGQVFLVGAGICGKVYCDLIAERGGIAIDIGAVCDAWLGIETRPLVALSRWGRSEIPRKLLLERQLLPSGQPGVREAGP